MRCDDINANTCISRKTTIGIPILVVFLRLWTYAFSRSPLGDPPESIQSGNYGQPPKVTWWLKQSFIYFLGLLGMKFCVFALFQLCPWIVLVGDWALKWTEGNETVQVFFVMLFFPVVMNALQYYIIDSFIKEQKPADHQQIPIQDGDDEDSDQDSQGRGSRSQLSDSGETLTNSSLDDEINKGAETATAREIDDRESKAHKSKKAKSNTKTLHEYNPATDGERNSRSGSHEEENLSEALMDSMNGGKRS